MPLLWRDRVTGWANVAGAHAVPQKGTNELVLVRDGTATTTRRATAVRTR